MRKSTLLVLTILIFMTKSVAQDCEYADYYPLFELARKNYSEKEYKEAERNIKLAFEKTSFPLGEGLHLALQIAQKQNDSEWAEQLAIKLAKGGVPLPYFRYMRKYDWYDDFAADFENYAQFYKENFNPKLREELLDIISRDKAFNKKFHEWRTRKIELTIDELIEGASSIISDFKKLTDEYGFPNERLTGYNYVRRTDRIEYFHTDVLMVHTYQRGVLMFENEIHDIVCEGGLHPNYEEILSKTRGRGNSTGVEQEMKARFKEFRGKK